MKTEYHPDNPVTIVVDLGFGDSGKGSVVDYLVRNHSLKTVVRFNGGPQAAHNVLTPGGRAHTFSQFGSGTFVAGTKTLLSSFMIVNPLNLGAEAEHLQALGVQDPLSLIRLDAAALLITPLHRAANRLREILRGDARHGSCAQGIGEAMLHRLEAPGEEIYAGDLKDAVELRRKIRALQYHYRNVFGGQLGLASSPPLMPDWAELNDPLLPNLIADQLYTIGKALRLVDTDYLAKALAEGGLVFEGAQGVLLDEWYGFHPYTTWSTCTPANALALLQAVGYLGPVEKLGLIRGYATRHGAGPFVTEDAALTARLPDPHNTLGLWQGPFRVGYADLVSARYAIAVSGGVDKLAITNLDRMAALGEEQQWQFCKAYRYQGDQEIADLVMANTGAAETNLRPKPNLEDLVYQERLTNLLENSRPEYSPAPALDDTFGIPYAEALADSLATPLGLISFGPTAATKLPI